MLLFGRANAVAGNLGEACIGEGTCTDTTSHVCDPSDSKCKVKADGVQTDCGGMNVNCPANAACTTDKCNCNTGYTEDTNGLCAAGNLGDACKADGTCTDTTNHVCDSSDSKCKVKADGVATNCQNSNDNCPANAACSSGTCSCNSGYAVDSNKLCTVGDVGGACNADRTCGSTTAVCDPSDFKCKVQADGIKTNCGDTNDKCPANSACSATTCSCNSGYTAHTSGLCTVIGDTCTVDSDCSSKITESYCAKQSPCSKGICTCKTGYSGPTCAILTYDKTCSSSANLCGTDFSCTNSKCVCSVNSWVSSVNACTDKKVFGEACTAHSDCYRDNTADGDCISSKCTCKTGFYEDTSVSGAQTCRLPYAGETCSSTCDKISTEYLSGSDSSQTTPSCTSGKCVCGSVETMYEGTVGSNKCYKYCLTNHASGTAKKADGATCTDHNECSGNICMRCPGDSNEVCYTITCSRSGIPLVNGNIVFLFVEVSALMFLL